MFHNALDYIQSEVDGILHSARSQVRIHFHSYLLSIYLIVSSLNFSDFLITSRRTHRTCVRSAHDFFTECRNPNLNQIMLDIEG